MGHLFSGDRISGSQEYQILHGKLYLVVSILVVVGYDFALDYDILFSRRSPGEWCAICCYDEITLNG